MSSTAGPLRLTYLGWSGFRIGWADGLEVLVDPPDATCMKSNQEAWLLLSHGHPEHVSGTAAYLASPDREAPVHVLASPPVCRFLRKCAGHPQDHFLPVNPGDAIQLPQLEVEVFGWHHMPLLPPEPKLAMLHLYRLLRHPGLLMGIIKDGLTGPPPGPLLGFRLLPAHGPRALFYSEGLHRRTGLQEAAQRGREQKSELLLFAAEPEDAAVLPELVAAIGSPCAIAYEAHRAWREELGMPQLNLEHLAGDLGARGIRSPRLAAHSPLSLFL